MLILLSYSIVVAASYFPSFISHMTRPNLQTKRYELYKDNYKMIMLFGTNESLQILLGGGFRFELHHCKLKNEIQIT